MTKYCNKYCNAGEKVLLHRQKCVIEHRDIRHSLRNSPPDCFCQMLRIWSLVSQVQILQINKKKEAGHSGCSTGRNELSITEI